MDFESRVFCLLFLTFCDFINIVGAKLDANNVLLPFLPFGMDAKNLFCVLMTSYFTQRATNVRASSISCIMVGLEMRFC